MKSFEDRLAAVGLTVRRRRGHAFLLEVDDAHLAAALAALRGRLLCSAETPCGDCRACRPGPHPDWVEVAPANGRAIGRDAVRGWPEQSLVPPVMGDTRVFVVRDAHRLTPDAGNLLLKLLEEPPPRVVVLLTTDGLHTILPTLKSRCRWLALRGGTEEERPRNFAWDEVWTGTDWTDRLLPAAVAIRAEISQGEAHEDPLRLIRRWDAVVEAALALERNANREVVRQNLAAAFDQ
jgi:DNA polymerase III delta prime subunit